MKLKNIFVSTIAVLAALVGCNKEEGPSYLDEIRVTSSYVSIPVEGGSGHIKLTATDSWEVTGAPDWLLVEPSRGTAGQEMDICFAAESTLDGRTCEVLLKCAGKTQRINVIQGLAVVSKATCKEVIDGPDSKNYLVTGICTKIANTQYGNWYIDDGTGEVYIYGTVDGTGKYNWSSFNIEVGDEVTVQGPKTTYNGTVELVDALFVSVNKSLIKVASINPESGVLPTAGGDITFTFENKGQGIGFEVPLEYTSWLSLKSISGNKVTLHAAANTAGPRDAILVFTTTDGKKEYTAETTVSQLGASGSEELPFTVTEAIEYCNTLSGESTSQFYVKGIISKIANNGEFGSYGNATFFISEDGEFHNDATLDFEAYRVLWLDNKDWKAGNAQIEVGAEVLICGTLTIYQGTAETAQKKAYIKTINGVYDEENGIGTKAAPFNTIGAIAAAKAGISSKVFINGTISKIQNEFSEGYGNATFWISDDGEYHNDKSLDFEAYQAYWLENTKWVATNPNIAVGDKVTLYGNVTTYNGTCETSAKNAYVYDIVK